MEMKSFSLQGAFKVFPPQERDFSICPQKISGNITHSFWGKKHLGLVKLFKKINFFFFFILKFIFEKV